MGGGATFGAVGTASGGLAAGGRATYRDQLITPQVLQVRNLMRKEAVWSMLILRGPVNFEISAEDEA